MRILVWEVHVNRKLRRPAVSALCALTLALGGLAALAAPAEAGKTEAKIVVSKNKTGPFDSSVHVSLSNGESRTFYLKVKNKGSGELELQMHDQPDSDVVQKWFTRFSGGKNITQSVESNYDITLQPDQVRKFSWKVKLIQGSACVNTLITWPPTNMDSVLAAVNTHTC
jgi:hypothetical protein